MKRIIFPIDRQENLPLPLNYCLDIAQKFGSEVILFHAYDLSNDFSEALSRYGNSSYTLNQITENLKKHGEDLLKKIEAEFSERGIKVKKVIVQGKPEREIISTATKDDCDLIIIGRRGFGSLKSLLLGSVSDYVLHHAEIPVFVVN